MDLSIYLTWGPLWCSTNFHNRNNIIECEHWKQSFATSYSNLVLKSKNDIADWGVSSQRFWSKHTEIKKMTKYQVLKNEVKRSWKMKSTKIVPVIIGAMGMIEKEPYKDIKKPTLVVIQTNCSWKLSGAQWRSWSWKEPSEQNSWEQEKTKTSQPASWIMIPYRHGGEYFETWKDSIPPSESHIGR